MNLPRRSGEAAEMGPPRRSGEAAEAGLSRRELLKGSGALIVTFGLAPGSAFGQVVATLVGNPSKEVDGWLAIAADGSVTAFTGKCEIGQGLYTAQTQLVAEELGVPIERVKLIQSDTALTPDQGRTWPELLSRRLHEAGIKLSVVNAGLSGNKRRGSERAGLSRAARAARVHNPAGNDGNEYQARGAGRSVGAHAWLTFRMHAPVFNGNGIGQRLLRTGRRR